MVRLLRIASNGGGSGKFGVDGEQVVERHGAGSGVEALGE
jgi:hypothetical protein